MLSKYPSLRTIIKKTFNRKARTSTTQENLFYNLITESITEISIYGSGCGAQNLFFTLLAVMSVAQKNPVDCKPLSLRLFGIRLVAHMVCCGCEGLVEVGSYGAGDVEFIECVLHAEQPLVAFAGGDGEGEVTAAEHGWAEFLLVEVGAAEPAGEEFKEFVF